MRVVRNVLALLLTQAGSWAVTLISTLVVPPYLGATRFGTLSFVNSYAIFFALGMNLGTGMYLTWRIAREPEHAGRLTFNTMLMQVPLALVCSIAALVMLPLVDRDPLVLQLTIVMLVSATMSAIASTATAALGGLQNMRVPAQLGLLGSALTTAFMIGCIILRQGLLMLAVAGLGGQLISLVLLLAYTARHIHLDLRLDLRLWRTIILGGFPFLAWSAVLLVYGQIDMTMLRIMAGYAPVGWYAAAYKIVSIPIFIPTVIITAVLPALSAERDATSPHFRLLASRAIRLVAAVAIPASAGTVMLATGLLGVLHYPASFAPATPLIAILALHIPIVALDMVLATAIVAIGKQHLWTCVGVVAAIFNPLMNLWLIPYTQHAYGNGAMGAAIVTVLTEVLMFVGACVLKPRTVFTRGDIFYVVRCLLGAAVMVPAVWALSGRLGVLVAVAYGLVIYAMAVYTLQVVRNDDLAELAQVALGKFGVGDLGDLRGLDAGALVARLGGSPTLTRLVGRFAGRARAAVGPVAAVPERAVAAQVARAAQVTQVTGDDAWTAADLPLHAAAHPAERERELVAVGAPTTRAATHTETHTDTHAFDDRTAASRRASMPYSDTFSAPSAPHAASAPDTAGAAPTSTMLSVVMCTCDRPDTIERAIRSVAEQDYPAFDLIVVDQSRGGETRAIVERLASEYPQVRYQHLDAVGLSRAYNAGVRATTGELLAFTDDDCIAPPTWLATIERAFAAEPDVELLYGQVLLPDELLARENVDGVTPALPIAQRRRMNQREGFEVFGMGANFAMRRSLFARVGEFDEVLGGGGPLKSAQDFDYTYRVFRYGGTILLDPAVVVYHYGFRAHVDWPATERAYSIGLGGFFIKHVRAGDAYAAWLLARAVALGSAREAKHALKAPHRAEWARVGNVFVGIRESFRFGVDRNRRLYTARLSA